VEETERNLLAVKARYIKLFSDKFKPTVQGTCRYSYLILYGLL